MSYTFRFRAAELDGAEPFARDTMAIQPQGDGVILLTSTAVDTGIFPKIGLVDPRFLFRLATEFPGRPAPSPPKDYFLVSFAAEDTDGAPGSVIYALHSRTLGPVSAETAVGPAPAPLGIIPGNVLFSGYFLQLTTAVAGHPATVEITIQPLGDAQVVEVACCLMPSRVPPP